MILCMALFFTTIGSAITFILALKHTSIEISNYDTVMLDWKELKQRERMQHKQGYYNGTV